jgi:hypothetical protein
VNAGSTRESFTPIGSNLPDYDNYFCRDRRRIVHVRKGSPGFRACPTPGCSQPTGFGAYATVPRRRPGARIRENSLPSRDDRRGVKRPNNLALKTVHPDQRRAPE